MARRDAIEPRVPDLAQLALDPVALDGAADRLAAPRSRSAAQPAPPAGTSRGRGSATTPSVRGGRRRRSPANGTAGSRASRCHLEGPRRGSRATRRAARGPWRDAASRSDARLASTCGRGSRACACGGGRWAGRCASRSTRGSVDGRREFPRRGPRAASIAIVYPLLCPQARAAERWENPEFPPPLSTAVEGSAKREKGCKTAAFSRSRTRLVCSPPCSRGRSWRPGGTPNRADCGEPVGRGRRSAQRVAERHHVRHVVRRGGRRRARRRHGRPARPERLHARLDRGPLPRPDRGGDPRRDRRRAGDRAPGRRPGRGTARRRPALERGADLAREPRVDEIVVERLRAHTGRRAAASTPSTRSTRS